MSSECNLRPVIGLGSLGLYATATIYFCLLLPMLATVEVSAKIRIPNSFVSGESPQDNHATTTTAIETEAVQEIDNDYDILFQNWITNTWSDEAQQQDNPSPPTTSTAISGRRYGFPLSSFKFASLTSKEYLVRIEKRLKTLHDLFNKTQEVLASGLVILWKITNDVVRYKFPVGIVTAWSAVVVVSKILKIQDKRRNKKKENAGDEGDESTQEETPDTYKYVLRHTGRALDLDADDLTSYRHLGGIEQVRSRLLRSALSEGVQRRNRDDGGEKEIEKEKLIEALLAALSMEFIPGGSHSEYIRDMIPSFSKAEECAHKLKIVPISVAATEGAIADFRRSTNHHRGSHEEDDVSADDDDDTRLLTMALQTAEIRIIDSKLRSIRDGFIRTTYRLDRTVKYWKSKVESERLSSSLMATTTTGSWQRFTLFSSSPIQRLKLRWSRLFNWGGGNAASVHNNPNFVHNSLLEGDRLRLAFAEAAYKAEIVRLGKVLSLLSRRPEEMPDSTLTNALVEQQQERRRQKEEDLLELKNLEERMQDCDDSPELEMEKERVPANEKPAPWNQIRSVAATTKDRIAKNFDRNKKSTIPAPVEKKNAAAALLQPFKSASQTISARWAQQRHRTKTKKPKLNQFFAIRFNADGRGKFSLQTYDEGSVAIEGNTAKRLLLRNYDAYQKPWLEETNAWALEARGLIVDTIRESVEASIHPVSSNIRSGGRVGGIGSSTYSDGAAATHTGLDDLESGWRVRKYVDPSDDGTTNDETHDTSAERQSVLFPALLSSKQASPPSSSSIPHRQWMFVYEMHRDINRLKRVGEGRSLKFKWKEVHWIHWLMQWNLVGLPSAALKIWVAAWIHDRSKPYVPRVQDLSREAYVVTMDFIMTRFWTPFKDLVDELMNRKKGLVTGVSLDEEEASLDTMLMDLGLGDGTSATRHEATIKATRQYESYMKSGLMMHALGGRLARLMLIQVQQLKVSMLDAAETIDVLFQSNKINMQLLAVIPAVGILFVGAKVFVRFLFSIRAKDLRPITSVHAEMTDYLNELESNIILRKGGGGQEKGATIQQFDDSNRPKSTSSAISGEEEEKQQLGEFALTLYNYLLLLDHSSPQPFSNRQCDVIHRSLTTFLGRNGSFGRDGVTVDGQSRLLDLVKGKHQELSKFL